MEVTKKVKAFDAVKMMRAARDKISSETQGMTFRELQHYINDRLEESRVKRIGQK